MIWKKYLSSCEIKETKRISLLKALVDDSIKSQIKKNIKDFKKWLEELIKITYIPSKQKNLFKELDRLHIKNFKSLKEFFNEFCKICNMINKCSERKNFWLKKKKNTFSRMDYHVGCAENWYILKICESKKKSKFLIIY